MSTSFYTDFSLKGHVLHFTEKTNARPFQSNRTYETSCLPIAKKKRLKMTTQLVSREIKASKVSNLRCGWSCRVISDTLVTLYNPRLERIHSMKSRELFSRLTGPAGV